jgi:hypothetical protein
MASRLELQTLLEFTIGSANVYFQPPASKVLSYPCIVYKLSDIDTTYANNVPYNLSVRYQIMVIDKNPDSQLPGKIALLPTCAFDRHYAADNLNHYVFNLYY